jgi:DNA polymerase III subunit gamma/tau
MSSTANESLHLKYRPKTLDRVVGNETTVAALRAMLAKGTVPHVMLLSGPRGSGKTTIARILKTELKCHDLDFRELNAADNRGIDTIRGIRQTMHNHPAAGPVRIWLVDEAALLTSEAQSAALKMWEDTPAHCYFFLATTDPDNLLPTIRDRCHPMPVRALTYKELEGLCDYVADEEMIELSDGVKDDLVAAAQGSARMLLVLLDKVANLDAAQQQAAIQEGVAEQTEAYDLFWALMNKKKWPTVSGMLKNLKSEPEKARWSILGLARVELLKSGNYQAYAIIDCFSRNFYDSKAAGLVMACFEAVSSKE